MAGKLQGNYQQAHSLIDFSDKTRKKEITLNWTCHQIGKQMKEWTQVRLDDCHHASVKCILSVTWSQWTKFVKLREAQTFRKSQNSYWTSIHNEGDSPHQRRRVAFVKAHKTMTCFKHFRVKSQRRAAIIGLRFTSQIRRNILQSLYNILQIANYSILEDYKNKSTIQQVF